MKPIIEVNNLYKKYKIGEKQSYYSFRDSIVNTTSKLIKKLAPRSPDVKSGRSGDFWALKNISFKVIPGEVMGIIGRNGAGKSTLLKILSRITPPTKGGITLRGKVASLLEVGTGFHPELTGRENIYLNGAILGMKRAEINDKFDEIVEFAEISKFLDTPVKFYSSGMYMRLAFAIAAHLEPEILLVDEVLAVGDAQFQKKCLGKMKEVSKQGRTVIFVSHNMIAIESLCSNALLIDQGKILASGSTKKIIDKYLGIIKNNTKQILKNRIDRIGKGNIKILKIEFRGENQSKILTRGKDIYVLIQIESLYKIIVKARLALTIGIPDKMGILSADSELIGKLYDIPPGDSLLTCKVNSPPLNSGEYYINVAIFNKDEPEDWIKLAANFSLEPSRFIDHVNLNNFPVLSKFEWNVAKIK